MKQISTSVQCIVNGKASGNLYVKAKVVENLYENFETHAIAGTKLARLLSSQTDEETTNTKVDTSADEPTTPRTPKPTRKRKKKSNLDNSSPKFSSPSQTSSLISHSPTSSIGSSSPKCGFEEEARRRIAINAAIAANRKRSPDHAAVKAAIAAYRGNPPGFPFPRYGSVHSRNTPSIPQDCQYCGPVCHVGYQHGFGPQDYYG